MYLNSRHTASGDLQRQPWPETSFILAEFSSSVLSGGSKLATLIEIAPDGGRHYVTRSDTRADSGPSVRLSMHPSLIQTVGSRET
jgi:hypothetical protein